MDSVKSSIMGRQEDDDEIYETVSRLNIRTGPGADYEKVRDDPLQKGTRLNLISTDSNWCYVEVIEPDDDDDDDISETGWVYGDYIKPI